ncbi:MAG: hypothetical protein L0H84_01060 [Pseudonocardia sp.]|nr:hypothetical protein [Pseudonocardia sp.]
MSTMHIKGHMLQTLAKSEAMWDYEIAEDVMGEYGLSGAYWYGTVRLTIADLYSGGLLDEVETTIDPAKSLGEEKLLTKYRLNDFGRTRMRQSGLMGANA